MMTKQVQHILTTLEAEGHSAFIVGGAVRDHLLGRTPKDFDIVTSAHPEWVEDIFEKTIPIGKSFGIITVMLDGEPFEIATLRKDGDYSDGRRPDEVVFTRDVLSDAARRDFTINAMYMTAQGLILDFHGGEADIQDRIIRAVGDPFKRFTEDKLRMLRAVRLAAQLGFEIDPGTMNAIKLLAPEITQVSAERIQMELVRTLCQ